MELNRKQLVAHLRMIHCGGAVPEVVLTPQLSAVALAQDRTLAAIAPAYAEEGFDGLFNDSVGVIDLGMMIQSLSAFAADDEVSVSFDKAQNRIVITETDDTIHLLTSKPKVIGTRMKDEEAEELQAVVPEEGVPLPKRVCDRIRKVQSLTSALEITLEVTAEGTEIKVGPGSSHYGRINMTDLVDETGPYSLTLQGHQVVRVLEQIDDWPHATIAVTGDDSIVVVKTGGFVYVLSPMAPVDD